MKDAVIGGSLGVWRVRGKVCAGQETSSWSCMSLGDAEEFQEEEGIEFTKVHQKERA